MRSTIDTPFGTVSYASPQNLVSACAYLTLSQPHTHARIRHKNHRRTHISTHTRSTEQVRPSACSILCVSMCIPHARIAHEHVYSINPAALLFVCEHIFGVYSLLSRACMLSFTMYECECKMVSETHMRSRRINIWIIYVVARSNTYIHSK